VLVEKVEPPGVFKLATWLGKRMDLHCTSVGKALIAHLSEEELARIMRETGLPRHNDNSIASLRKLKEDLARSRQLGYFIDDEEDEIGYRCIGAPIVDETGQAVAAVSISGSNAQVREDNSRALAREVIQTAADIARSLANAAPTLKEIWTPWKPHENPAARRKHRGRHRPPAFSRRSLDRGRPH
jgi:DNA-binding IclR family transcriptional regulator